MENSFGLQQSSDDKSVLLERLRKEQAVYSEGSFEYADIQYKMNRIIAENFLQYVNR